MFAQLMARRTDYLGKTDQDKSRLYKDVLESFDRRWFDLTSRLALVPGKEVLGLLRDRVQGLHGVTLTDARIAEAMIRTDIPDDMFQLLNRLEDFRTAAI